MQVLWLIFREASQGELAFWKHRNSRGMELKPLRFQFWVINLVFSFNRCFSSVQFSSSVVSDSLQPHESQHTRPHCPSPTPGVHWNSCPSSWWYHPAISSSVIRFSSCPQFLPASESYPKESTPCMRWPKYWSFSFSISLSNEHPGLFSSVQDLSPLEWTGWISLQSKGLSRVFSNTTVPKHQFFGAQFSSQSNSHIHTWPLKKP